jgi:uncharacterized small protein (DUF1192 family)
MSSMRKLERDFAHADAAAVNGLLAQLGDEDVMARFGLEARLADLQAEIARLDAAGDEPVASAALFFGGRPVLGQRGIESEFAGTVITKFQDIVAKVLARWVTPRPSPTPAWSMRSSRITPPADVCRRATCVGLGLDSQYVYHNVSRFVKVYKMHTAKIKPLFKPGDRVIWDDTAYNKKRKATVIACCDDEYYTIEVDSKYSKYNTFNVHVDNLDPMPKEVKIADKEYAVKCAKWFKSAYAAITKAGGVPEYVIDSIPADVLDNLIRNDLHLEYKK